MRSAIYTRAPWTKQPPIGTKIDWSNPLTNGLKHFYLVGPGGAWDAVTGTLFPPSTGGLILPAKKGWAYYNPNDNDHLEIGSPDTYPLDASNGVTVMVMVSITTFDAAYGTLIGSGGAADNFAIYIDPTPGDVDTYIDSFDNGPFLDISLNPDHYVCGVAWSHTGTNLISDRFGYNDGVFQALNLSYAEATQNLNLTDLWFGQDEGFSARTAHGYYYCGAFWNRPMTSVAEQRMISENPWRVFKPRTIYIAKPEDVRMAPFKRNLGQDIRSKF